jgi:hypothetical protein
LSTIFDNHQLLLQYDGRDPIEEQWRCNIVDQPIKRQYVLKPSQEPQFGQKPYDPHQWDSSKNLKNANLSEYKVKKLSKKLKGFS